MDQNILNSYSTSITIFLKVVTTAEVERETASKDIMHWMNWSFNIQKLEHITLWEAKTLVRGPTDYIDLEASMDSVFYRQQLLDAADVNAPIFRDCLKTRFKTIWNFSMLAGQY